MNRGPWPSPASMGHFSVDNIDIDNANLSKDDAGGSVSVFCTKLLEQFGGAFIVNVGPVGEVLSGLGVFQTPQTTGLPDTVGVLSGFVSE